MFWLGREDDRFEAVFFSLLSLSILELPISTISSFIVDELSSIVDADKFKRTVYCKSKNVSNPSCGLAYDRNCSHTPFLSMFYLNSSLFYKKSSIPRLNTCVFSYKYSSISNNFSRNSLISLSVSNKSLTLSKFLTWLRLIGKFEITRHFPLKSCAML